MPRRNGLLIITSAALLLISAFSLPAQTTADSLSDGFAQLNSNLAAELALQGRGINSSLIDEIKKVPRHLFSSEAYADIAYENIALPGSDHGFTAAPLDILRAIELLSPSSNDKILIAGNNAGYAAALLSGLAAEVYLIEETSAAADYPAVFESLNIKNITVSETADINSFSEIIAFDKIFICGAVPQISEDLTERLSIQGNITFVMAENGGFQQIITMRRSLLGDSITCGGSCYFPFIKELNI